MQFLDISPKDDIVFKMIFGDNKHTKILIHFLNCVVKGKSPITSVDIIKNELAPEYVGQKGTRLDVLATTQDGELINIEIQRRDEGNITARSLFYWSKVFAGQMNVSENYKDLKRTISINILDFTLFKNDARYWRKGFIKDDDSNEQFTDLLEMHFLELNKMKQVEDESPISFWLEFLKNPYSDKVQKLCEFIPEIKEAKEVFERVQYDPVAREQMRLREKSILDYNHGISNAEEKGRVEGKAEGEHKKAIDTAKNFIKMGLSLEQVAQGTGLSVDELEKL